MAALAVTPSPGYRGTEHLCVSAVGVFACGLWFGGGGALLCALWAVVAYPGGRRCLEGPVGSEAAGYDRVVAQFHVVWMRTRQGWRAVYRDEVTPAAFAALRRLAR